MRENKELIRKLIHMGTILLPMLLKHLGPYHGKIFLALLVLVAVITEFLRLETEWFGRIFNMLFGEMLKNKEVTNLTGATAYIVAALLSSMLFNWEVVITSLFFLSLGDPMASIVGRKWGKHRLMGSKSVEGTIAFLAVAILVACFYRSLPILVRLSGAVSAALIESIETPIDDNITVLLGSGAIMQILLLIHP